MLRKGLHDIVKLAGGDFMFTNSDDNGIGIVGGRRHCGSGNGQDRCSRCKYHLYYVHNGRDTFVGANARKDVVAGSGVGPGLAARAQAPRPPGLLSRFRDRPSSGRRLAVTQENSFAAYNANFSAPVAHRCDRVRSVGGDAARRMRQEASGAGRSRPGDRSCRPG